MLDRVFALEPLEPVVSEKGRLSGNVPFVRFGRPTSAMTKPFPSSFELRRSRIEFCAPELFLYGPCLRGLVSEGWTARLRQRHRSAMDCTAAACDRLRREDILAPSIREPWNPFDLRVTT
uniref:Uncharacterized protein n=1 Tax=Ixodes ricinus TaxID=34613 RepID=A0A6B0UNF6_IXORI